MSRYFRNYLGAYPENVWAGIWKPQDVFFKQKDLTWTSKVVAYDPINHHDIFYALGTKFGTQTWANPAIGNNLITASSTFQPVLRPPSRVINRQGGIITKPPIAIAGQNNEWASDNSGTSWLQVNFENKKVKVSAFVIENRNNNDWSNHGITNGLFQASNDGITWLNLESIPSLQSSEFFIRTERNYNTFYQYYRFLNGVPGIVIIGEIYFWGEIIQL